MNTTRANIIQNQQVEIANTILSQIGTVPLMAYGVPHKSIRYLEETDLRLGGVRFNFSNCPNIRNGVVVVELLASDTYKITIISLLGIVHSEQKDIFCDQLTDYLDEQLG